MWIWIVAGELGLLMDEGDNGRIHGHNDVKNAE